jgi:hypothetical protein
LRCPGDAVFDDCRHDKGWQTALILPTASTPRRVLEIVGITEAVPLFASVDDAVTHLRIG